MKKIVVVLNSGGFDSAVLLAELSHFGECEIHSIYFDCGQINNPQCSRIAKENAETAGAIHHEVKLPKFSWTKSTFYTEGVSDYDGQYLEMRNLVFISYAMSLADSVGAEEIYAAILNNTDYKDTSTEFLDAVSNLCESVGMQFFTPLSQYCKRGLFEVAKFYGVGTKYKYFSCDNPVNGSPCHVCDDCKDLDYYEKEILGLDK